MHPLPFIHTNCPISSQHSVPVCLRYRTQLQAEKRRNNELSIAVRSVQRSQSEAAGVYLRGLNALDGPNHPQVWTTAHGELVSTPPAQRPASGSGNAWVC